MFSSLIYPLQGTLKVLKYQGLCAAIFILSNYIISLPMAYYFSFEADMGLEGTWYGLTLGLATAAALLFALVLSVDWDAVIEYERRT